MERGLLIRYVEIGVGQIIFLVIFLSQALGTGFSRFAGTIFQKCMNIIQSQQLAKVDPTSVGFKYDKELIVCCLDLFSGLTKGLGAGIEDQVSQSNLRELLLQCCVDVDADVWQSAIALLGDLARPNNWGLEFICDFPSMIVLMRGLAVGGNSYFQPSSNLSCNKGSWPTSQKSRTKD